MASDNTESSSSTSASAPASNSTANMSIDSMLSTFSPDTTAAMTSDAPHAMIFDGKTIDYHLLSVRQLIIMLSERRLVPSFKDSLIILLLQDDERQYRAAAQASSSSSTIRPVVVDDQRSGSPELGAQDDRQASLDALEDMVDRYLERRQGSENLRARAEEDLSPLPSDTKQG
ncbi:hypothetical protein EYC84_004327 [Monilinia fructicola]|uniref:Uncharacterized protein n=1 Tax=Monilinia fructicola TaxID=38448 RepID=A0A5M9K8C1_MONFR|nr:hypothetical protein EYC84_004327 [Monilinia fructicola]